MNCLKRNFKTDLEKRPRFENQAATAQWNIFCCCLLLAITACSCLNLFDGADSLNCLLNTACNCELRVLIATAGWNNIRCCLLLTITACILLHFGHIQERYFRKINPKFIFRPLMTSCMTYNLWRHVIPKLHQLVPLYITWHKSRDVISGRYHVMKMISLKNPGKWATVIFGKLSNSKDFDYFDEFFW